MSHKEEITRKMEELERTVISISKTDGEYGSHLLADVLLVGGPMHGKTARVVARGFEEVLVSDCIEEDPPRPVFRVYRNGGASFYKTGDSPEGIPCYANDRWARYSGDWEESVSARKEFLLGKKEDGE